MEKYPIYTEINNCRDCYKCVRTCPVKAIQIRDAHAEILHDRCTYCGTCVNACPNGVKVIRNDVDKVSMAFLSDIRPMENSVLHWHTLWIIKMWTIILLS